jgi:multiple sugar transport system permease protein
MDRARHAVVRASAPTLIALGFLAPLVLLVLGAFGRSGEVAPGGWAGLLDPRWSLENFRAALAIVPLERQVANSLLVISLAVPVTLAVTASAGFAVAASAPQVRRWLIGLTVVIALVPPAALWVPRVVGLRWLGLGGETVSVAVVALAGTSPLFVLLYALAFWRVPASTLEAARCEGLSSAATWWRVALPQVRGTTVAVAALALVAHWGNTIEPVLLLTDPRRQTAAIGIRTLGTLEPTLYPVFLAGAVLVTLPPTIAFILLQRGAFGVLGPTTRRLI